MHHEMRAGAAVGAIEGVREAEIEREIIFRVRVHLPRRDVVEPFRRLPVALGDLRAEVARPLADRVGFQQREPALAILLPHFQLGFHLEHAQQDRRADRHVLLRHLGQQLRRDGRVRLAGDVGQEVGLAARQCRGSNQRCRARQHPQHATAFDKCRRTHSQAASGTERTAIGAITARKPPLSRF